jgi:hypothetical protein
MHPPGKRSAPGLGGTGAERSASTDWTIKTIRHPVSDVKSVGEIIPHVLAEIFGRQRARVQRGRRVPTWA